jgi:hypothetical protein
VFDTVQADQVQRAQTVDGLNKQLNTQLGEAITPSAAESFLSGGANATNLIEGAGRLALGLAAANSGGHAEPQHRPPEDRKKGLAQYSADAYPEGAPLRDEQTSWLGQVRATREFAQGKVAVGAVTDAQLARAKGDYGGASAAIGRARSTMFGHAPLVLNEAARLAADKGDHREAERLFSEADASEDQTVVGMVDHVRFLYQSGEYDRARQVVNAGVQRFNDQKPFIALAIGIARAQNQEQEMEGYLATCEGYRNDALARDCRLAAGHSAEAPHHDAPHIPSGLPFGIPHF